jgi:hypothetical protein
LKRASESPSVGPAALPAHRASCLDDRPTAALPVRFMLDIGA